MTDFVTTNTDKIKYENKIIYDYPECTVNRNEITKSSGKITSFTFLNQTPEPNFTYTQSESSTASLYHKKGHILAPSFTVDDRTDVTAHFIIEHTSLSDSSNKHFVCFLLKPMNNDNANEMDKLIECLYSTSNETPITKNIELNKCIPNQENCIIFNTSKKIPVYVFTTPINIDSTTLQYITPTNSGVTTPAPKNDLFVVDSKTSYSLVPSTNITVKDGDDIYIDCSPTGESQETINTYSIPINSDMETSLDARDTMKTATNFALFTMFALTISIVSPYLYKWSIIRYVLNNSTDQILKKEGENDVNSGVGLRTIDMFIGFLSFIIILITLIVGFNKDYFPLILGGLIFSTGVILSSIAIFKSKQDSDFLSLNNKEIHYGSTVSEIANAPYFNWEAFKYLILDFSWFMPFLLGIITIVTTMIVQLYIAETNATGGLVTMGAFFIIAIIMYIYSHIKSNAQVNPVQS